MMKQFLFEQLSNSVQNTTNKLLTHLEDNQKIISLLDNLLYSMTNSQVNQMQIEQVQDDIEKISEFVSEILGTLDSCLFTLEYNTQKYVQHLTKKKDDIQALSNIDDMDFSNSQNGRAQENQLMRNNLYMGNYNNMQQQPLYLYQDQQQYDDENEEEYGHSDDYQQINNGFNGIEGDDEDDIYDEENGQIYLEEEEYDEQNQQHQQNIMQNKSNMNQQLQQLNAQQIYYKQPQSKITQKNQIQTQLDKTKQNKFTDQETNSNNSNQQKITQNSNLNNQKQSTKTKTVSANLTVNDIFN
ncbi:hypothetical protein ABPG72_017243 [Tetrahymena utriculariae]